MVTLERQLTSRKDWQGNRCWQPLLQHSREGTIQTHTYEQYPRVSRGVEEERLDRTDSMITTTTVIQTQSRLP